MSKNNDIVAIGGDLNPASILRAYKKGIFPWPHEGYELLWFCPDPRFVLRPTKLIINRSLQKAIRHSKLIIKADTDFLSVIKKCQSINRAHQKGTWITKEMKDSYYLLHQQGFAHSIEAYDDNYLVGGLYGISMGSIFFGESMFSEQSNASKIAFVTLIAHLQRWGFSLIDCQAHTHTLEKFGAVNISRLQFLNELKEALKKPDKVGPWHLEMPALEALSYLLMG